MARRNVEAFEVVHLRNGQAAGWVGTYLTWKEAQEARCAVPGATFVRRTGISRAQAAAMRAGYVVRQNLPRLVSPD